MEIGLRLTVGIVGNKNLAELAVEPITPEYVERLAKVIREMDERMSG